MIGDVDIAFLVSRLLPHLGYDLSNQFPIFAAERYTFEQVRAIAQGLLEGLAAAPTPDLRVIPRNQHLRHLHAAIVGGPGVMRVIQQASRRAGRSRRRGLNHCPAGLISRSGCISITCLYAFAHLNRAEALLPRRSFVAECARNQANYSVGNDGSRQPATAKDVIAD